MLADYNVARRCSRYCVQKLVHGEAGVDDARDEDDGDVEWLASHLEYVRRGSVSQLSDTAPGRGAAWLDYTAYVSPE